MARASLEEVLFYQKLEQKPQLDNLKKVSRLVKSLQQLPQEGSGKKWC